MRTGSTDASPSAISFVATSRTASSYAPSTSIGVPDSPASRASTACFRASAIGSSGSASIGSILIEASAALAAEVPGRGEVAQPGGREHPVFPELRVQRLACVHVYVDADQ